VPGERENLSLAAKFESVPATTRALSFQDLVISGATPVSAQNTGKQAAARAALEFVEAGKVLGVGTGTTVNFLIDELATRGVKIAGAVSSSNGSTQRLEAAGFRVLDLNEVGEIDTYIDGADETNHRRQLIKGGGAALTREKIIAAASRRFVCIADESKLVDTLGAFPLPVEVIPMARMHVSRALERLGGRPVWRQAVVTDNGNHILDVHGLSITDPVALESAINGIVGVVTSGLFAARPADLLILGNANGIRRI
jgi:ribose 5-phosphate isomerase A